MHIYLQSNVCTTIMRPLHYHHCLDAGSISWAFMFVLLYLQCTEQPHANICFTIYLLIVKESQILKQLCAPTSFFRKEENSKKRRRFYMRFFGGLTDTKNFQGLGKGLQNNLFPLIIHCSIDVQLSEIHK